MNNVLNTSTERQPLTLMRLKTPSLARWEDPDEASENETEAALDTEEETTGDEFDEEDTYEEVDLEEETDPEETDDDQEEDDDEAVEAEVLADDAEIEIYGRR